MMTMPDAKSHIALRKKPNSYLFCFPLLILNFIISNIAVSIDCFFR